MRFLLVYSTLLGMEICWLFAVLKLTNKAVSDQLSIPLLILTLLISFAISRILRGVRWPKFILTCITWIIWPVFMLLMIKFQLFLALPWTDPSWLQSVPLAFTRIFDSFEPALLIIISTAILWLLGRRLAYVKANFSAVMMEFQFGLVILVITFFFAYELNYNPSGSLPETLIFFAAGLLGISISHAQDNTWFDSGRRGEWSGILILSIGLVLLLGVLISVLVTPDLLQAFLNALKWLWEMLEKFLIFLASLLPEQEAPSPIPEQPAMGGDNSTDSGFSLPEWLQPGFKMGYTIAICIFIIFVIYRVCSDLLKWMRRQIGRSGGEVESLKGAFRMDLINWFKRILSRIFGIKFGIKKPKSENIPPDQALVRQIYLQMLGWGARRGIIRQKSQTAVEYTRELSSVLPENKSDLDFMTQQYLEVRYGLNHPETGNFERFKQTWNDLKKVKIKNPGSQLSKNEEKEKGEK